MMAYATSCFCVGVVTGLWYDSISLAPALLQFFFPGDWAAAAAAWSGGLCGRMLAAALCTKALVRMGRSAHLRDTFVTAIMSACICGACMLPVVFPFAWTGAATLGLVMVLQLCASWYLRRRSAYEHYFRSKRKLHMRFCIASTLVLGTTIVEGIAFDVFGPSLLIPRIVTHAVASVVTCAWALAVLARDLRWMQRVGFEVHYTWIHGSRHSTTAPSADADQGSEDGVFYALVSDDREELES